VKLAVVLGGGGLKGFAHLGVLRALEERGVRPHVWAGTSIGALIAAAYTGGTPIAELERRADALRQTDLFRIDHFGMVARRMKNTSLYLGEPLRRLVEEIVPEGTFAEWPAPLLVNTVNLEQGEQVVFGLPGLRDVSVRDAVYASCALPGFFPPGQVGDFTCVDGGVMDNVPARAASLDVDCVFAVDVGSTSLAVQRRIYRRGFAAVYQRSAQTMMHALQHAQLALWSGPPLVLSRPRVWHFSWFAFGHAEQFRVAGYEAALESLDVIPDALMAGSGVWPKRQIEISVDRAKCTKCTLCVTMAPEVMRLDPDGYAEPRVPVLLWSRADGHFVHQCPTDAIEIATVEGAVRRLSVQEEAIDD
jgi:NTE family protein